MFLFLLKLYHDSSKFVLISYELGHDFNVCLKVPIRQEVCTFSFLCNHLISGHGRRVLNISEFLLNPYDLGLDSNVQ